MGTSYEEFLAALRMRESSDNYQVVNTEYGYLGAYQFTEAALIDLGFVNPDGNVGNNDFSGGWTGYLGIDSTAEFLATPSAQDAAVGEFFEMMWGYLTDIGADAYLGRTIDGIVITASGLIGGAHLLGQTSVLQWLQSGGDAALNDVFGTPISEYISLFSGYSLPFLTDDTTPGGGSLVASAPEPVVTTPEYQNDVFSFRSWHKAVGHEWHGWWHDAESAPSHPRKVSFFERAADFGADAQAADSAWDGPSGDWDGATVDGFLV